MAIDEKTREQRVVRWKARKSAWESKLAKAANENDTAEAKAMIAEAEVVIERLEAKDSSKEKTVETKGAINVPKKKVINTDAPPRKTKDVATGTISH